MKELQIGEKRGIRCRSCQKITNHELLYRKVWTEQHPDYLNYWWSVNQVFQCLGCNEVCLSIAGSFDDDINPETGEYMFEEQIYPNPNKSRSEIKSWIKLPKKVRDIYKETVNAVNNNLVVLASVGVGSVIEAICNDKGVKAGNLLKKIDKLTEMGAITEEGAKLLHIAREHRNVSAHEHNPMSERQLHLCLDVIDSLLMNIYVLPQEFELFNAGEFT